jgi:hypothetical protein
MTFSSSEDTRIVQSIEAAAASIRKIADSVSHAASAYETYAKAYAESVRKQPDLSGQAYTVVVNVEGDRLEALTTQRIKSALKHADEIRRPQDH